MSFSVVKVASLLLAGLSLAVAPAAVAQAAASADSAVSSSDAPHSSTPVAVAPGADDSLPPITVQIAPPPISISSSMIGVAGPLGAQAATGKPLSAEFLTVHHQSFTDGNHISRSTTSMIYRDAEGRIRRESQLSVPGLPASDASATFITIVDHRLGYGWVLNPQEMVAHRYDLNDSGPSYVAHVSAQGSGGGFGSPDSKPSSDSAAVAAENPHWRAHVFAPHHSHPWPDAAASPAGGAKPDAGSGPFASSFQLEDTGFASAPNMRIDQPFLAAPNPVRTENLGEQMLLGYRVHGTRVITTVPSGEIGNDRPIDIVSEQWFSPDLELVMRSVHRDPWGGEFTTTVNRLKRGDQPAWLFEVPSAYKVIDSDTEREHHILDSRGDHTGGSAPW